MTIVCFEIRNDVFDHSLVALAAQLGISTLSKGGSFPWVYRGVAHILYHSVHVYLTCEEIFPCDLELF